MHDWAVAWRPLAVCRSQSFPWDLRRRTEDASDEVSDPDERHGDVRFRQLEFEGELRKRLRPMGRHGGQIGRPRMRSPTAEDQFACLTKSDVVVGDQCFHQEQIDQVSEPLVLLARPRWKRQSMQLLRDVEPEWQARQPVPGP